MAMKALADHQGCVIVVARHDADTFRLVLVPDELDTYSGYVPWIRPIGLDAPEVGDEGWEEAEQYAINLIATAREVTVVPVGWSFDRQLCRVLIYNNEFAYGVDFANAMIDAGYAKVSSDGQ